MQLKIPIPLGLNYHYESRKANFSPLGFQDLEWETKTIHEGYQGPSSPRAYQLERGWGITATLKGVLVGRYASLKKQIVFEISLKSCSIPSVPFFPYAFSGEGLRHFKSLELHKLLYLWRSSQFNVSCLLCFLHPGSCLQRLEQTQLQPL